MARIVVEPSYERRVWSLLTQDFYWRVPEDYPVRVLNDSNPDSETRLQIFEVLVAAVFARLRPEYDWYVTPNRPDGGLDFVGEQTFLLDTTLGIEAAVTVGGQCKKRSRVDDIVGEVSGSLARMVSTIDPTFFVVALSARLDRRRVDEAQKILETAHHRHCHILDRGQIEGLLVSHLDVVRELLVESLQPDEITEVLGYLDEVPRPPAAALEITVVPPMRVLAGVPFSVPLMIRSQVGGSERVRLWWRPSDDGPSVTLLGPVGAETAAGFALHGLGVPKDPLATRSAVEMLIYSIGSVSLGKVAAGSGDAPEDEDWVNLGEVVVVENLRPRFFDRPFQGALTALAEAYARSLAIGCEAFGVVGAGGSGKSRLCEEFCIERRRRGAVVVVANQAKTLDDPTSVIANLLLALSIEELEVGDAPATSIVRSLSQFDQSLADRAAPAIKAALGSGGSLRDADSEQLLLSTILVLVAARARTAPLVVHLQDLHWCTPDVLSMLERLLWQLNQVLSRPEDHSLSGTNGVLFLIEGRVGEQLQTGQDVWSSEPFETFLSKLDCERVRCRSMDAEDGLEFSRRLFEDEHSSHRLVAKNLLSEQRRLVARIHRSAGGNPFHTLAQLQLLKERRCIGQNPATGLLYMIRPEPNMGMLPDSVAELIHLRWQDLRVRSPTLALLLWAAALVDDRIPAPLFRRLRQETAPQVSLREIESTDFLWSGDSAIGDIGFGHENYFQALRQFEVNDVERDRVVAIYAQWFSEQKRLDPADRFRWARVLLKASSPDLRRIRRVLSDALRGARRRGDLRLVRRILSVQLDLAWSEDASIALPRGRFLRMCDSELELCRDLLRMERAEVEVRLNNLEERIANRLGSRQAGTPGLERRQIEAQVIRSLLLCNDRKLSVAADVAAQAVAHLHILERPRENPELSVRLELEMEAAHAQGVAAALSGRLNDALVVYESALETADVSTSPLSFNVISTYANVLTTFDPGRAEKIQRRCITDMIEAEVPLEITNLVEVHLTLALVTLANSELGSDRATAHLYECEQILNRVFSSSYRLGLYPDAGAAAVQRGVVSALRNDDDEASWFAQGVSAASRGRQMETLWRAHINLATALDRADTPEPESVRNHASAALDIMSDTLVAYPEPEKTPRFDLLRVPLAHAVRYLLAVDDETGVAALERFPSLRSCFADPIAGVLREDLGGLRTRHWLQVDAWDYVLY